ncbi:hypothetical protein SDC9_149985 [bioreactor metagenome]|uniref:Uncharacterized protein n=1 Tax=bioreactor metagenome TaxID=1076179 RepID=A0A645ENQ6_9ZZZZ
MLVQRLLDLRRRDTPRDAGSGVDLREQVYGFQSAQLDCMVYRLVAITRHQYRIPRSGLRSDGGQQATGASVDKEEAAPRTPEAGGTRLGSTQKARGMMQIIKTLNLGDIQPAAIL